MTIVKRARTKKSQTLTLDELLTKASKWTACLKKELGTKRSLRESFEKGTDSTTNILFDLFGRRRYERVIHEFIGSMMDNPRMDSVGHHLKHWFFKRCKVSVKTNTRILVTAESCKEDTRFDLLLRTTEGHELGLELKVDCKIDPTQLAAYNNWKKRQSRRSIALVTPQYAELQLSAPLITWNEVASFLKEQVDLHKREITLSTEELTFVNRFIDGIAEL